jgi:hypothetical protein
MCHPLSARHFQNPMFDLLIILVMVGIAVSLGFGLYFLVKDRGKTERTVRSLTVRVGLAVLLLVILAIGFMSRSPA